MLLLHLGGPDTITAYVLEDNQLWTRHLLGLVVQTSLVIYVLFLSWTSSWLPHVMNSSMFIAGIIKYIERTWSLMLASSGQAKGTIPVFDIDTLVEKSENLSEEEKLVVGYQFFSALRPDITNYISPRENLSSSGTKLIMRFMNNVQMTGLWNINMDYLFQTLDNLDQTVLYEILEVELGFMFDVLYTKVPVMYTKVGCIFRFISVSCSLCALLLFFIFFRVEPGNHLDLVDIIITWILLVGAIIIELYAILRLVYSDWTVLWINSRHSKNRFLYRILGNFLSSFPRRSRKRKRWSESMGQFNLVSYCFNYKKAAKMTGKMSQRNLHTEFSDVPNLLKEFGDSFSLSTKFAFIAPRGEKALEAHSLKKDLRWSIELDFDESIITWHLVTDICYHKIHHSSEADQKGGGCFGFSCFGFGKEARRDVAEPELEEGLLFGFGRFGKEAEKLEDTCQVISNYMMYLLVMQPDMILPGYLQDFWFSHVCKTLGEFFDKQSISKKGEQNPYELLDKMKSQGGSGGLEENAWKIVERLDGEDNKWKIIKDVWLEMLCYAAVACPHVNHARYLRRGGEYLTHLWLRLTMSFLLNS
ncbi:hypothetical protein CCACVL1_30046 [Corchorus capsularis]|uniref:DUF4220 domain-containing protein n=1 Tax=Corchorus capsularis TaxID=210143 RepID=A0A1R3FYX3_COCAP|nr:hypothetical protein CCACVL1_30046 [Corchorus capsularis]